MFMVREVLHCNPGKVRPLVTKFQDLGALMGEMGLDPFRIFTDVSGAPFWTLVLERDYESLEEIQALEAKVMGDERAQQIMAGYHDLVHAGKREIYRIES